MRQHSHFALIYVPLSVFRRPCRKQPWSCCITFDVGSRPSPRGNRFDRDELIEEAQSIVDLIEDQGGDELGDHAVRLGDYVRRLQHLQSQTVGQLWSNSAQAVPAYLFTLIGLRKALIPVLTDDGHAQAVVKLKKLATQLRGMEGRLSGLEPRTASLALMVERIEHAYNAADQLPADLESLSEARHKMDELVKEAMKDQGSLSSIREQADRTGKQLNQSAEDAKAVLVRCETAYSAATSVGLAAAFSERSTALSRSMCFWVAGLVVALVAGAYFGSS